MARLLLLAVHLLLPPLRAQAVRLPLLVVPLRLLLLRPLVAPLPPQPLALALVVPLVPLIPLRSTKHGLQALSGKAQGITPNTEKPSLAAA